MFQFEKNAGINFTHQTYCGEKCIIFQFVLFAVFLQINLYKILVILKLNAKLHFCC